MTITSTQVYRVGAVLFGILAVISGSLALSARWVPALDFDVVGFLWVMSNLPLLFIWGLTLLFVALAIYCIIKPHFDRWIGRR